MKEIRKRVLKVGLGYAILGGLWIFLSDLLVSAVLDSEAQISFWQTIKGWFYVGGTALILSIWFSRHLTRQSRIAEALSESEAESQIEKTKSRETSRLLETLLEKAPVMVSLMDSDLRVLWVNEHWETTFGWAREELEHVNILNELYPDPSYRRAVQQFIRTAPDRWEMFRPQNRSGRRLAVEYLNVQLADGTNLAIGRDLTEQRASTEFRSRLFERTQDLMAVSGFDDSMLELNPAWEKVLGWNRDEITGRRWLDLIHPADLESTLESRSVLRRGLPIAQFENRYRRRDGSYRRIAWNSFPLVDEKLIVAVGRDVTESRQRQYLQTQLFEYSLDLLCIVDMAGNFRELNPAWERALGFSNEELLSRPWIEIVHPADRAAIVQEYRRLKQGEPVSRFEGRAQCKDGSFRVISLTAFPVVEEELAFVVARDITDQKRLEAQFLHAQKIESLARMVGGISHDFNNLLAAIMAHAQLAELDLPVDNPVHKSLLEITKGARRAARLIDRLLLFSRRQQESTERWDVNQLINEMVSLLRPLLEEHVQLVLDLGTEVGAVQLDRSRFEQVMMNLCVNAKDAMPGGGRLTLSTRTRKFGPGESALPPGQRFVEIAVSDTGTGIPEELLNHIFEPFFTTKEAGRGTGLGLSTVYGIVRAASGEIVVDSQLGVGTTFTIRLPEVGEDSRSPASGLDEALPRGTETVLVAEDENILRRAIGRLLSALGYSVLEAESGEEALEVARSHSGRIDLLLTDVIMSGISGPDLAEEFERLVPAAKVMLMTGHSGETVARLLSGRQQRPLLRKPFDQAAVAKALRTLLDEE